MWMNLKGPSRRLYLVRNSSAELPVESLRTFNECSMRLGPLLSHRLNETFFRKWFFETSSVMF